MSIYNEIHEFLVLELRIERKKYKKEQKSGTRSDTLGCRLECHFFVLTTF